MSDRSGSAPIPRRQVLRLLGGGLLLASVGDAITACGTGSSAVAGRGTGTAVVSVAWPKVSRLIPAAANSVVITVMNGATKLASQVVARPTTASTSTATFPNLPPGTVQITAAAFPSTDGSGVADSSGSASTTIVSNSSVNVSFTMSSTVKTLTISLVGGAASLNTGVYVQATATGVDAGGNQVLLTPSHIQWSSNSSSAGVSATGLVSGVSGGVATITATDNESGVSGTLELTVLTAAASPILTTDFINGRVSLITNMSGAGYQQFVGNSVVTAPFGPTGVALDPALNIYVADTKQHRIVKMSNINGANAAVFGTQGAGTNQFHNPQSIALDSQGRIYVADTYNNRIVRVDDLLGTNFVTFGTGGSGTGQFTNPFKVVVDTSNRIYICDALNNRIVRINDMTGAGWVSFGTLGDGTGAGQLNDPHGITVDLSNRIYIADTNNNRIVRIDDMTGTNETAYGTKFGNLLSDPWDVKADNAGFIYVSDTGNNRLLRMNDLNGTNLLTLGSFGTGANQFEAINGITTPVALSV